MPPRKKKATKKKAPRKSRAKEEPPPATAAELFSSIQERMLAEQHDKVSQAYSDDSMRLEQERVKKEQELKKAHAAELLQVGDAHGRAVKGLQKAIAKQEALVQEKSRELIELYGRADRGGKAREGLRQDVVKAQREIDSQRRMIETLVLSVQVPALDTKRRMLELLEYPKEFLDGLLDDATRAALLEGRTSDRPAERQRLQGNMGKLFEAAVNAVESIPDVLPEHGTIKAQVLAAGFSAQGVWVHPCGKERKIGLQCAVGAVCPDCGQQAPKA